MANWIRLTRQEGDEPIFVNLGNAVLIRPNNLRQGTDVCFPYGNDDGLFFVCVQETPEKIIELADLK